MTENKDAAEVRKYTRMPVLPRFLSKIKKTKSCWLWKGATGESGHGQFGINYRNVQAHRFSYENFVGPIPAGLEVCHKCNVPNCVNPKHLYVATHRQNVLDAKRDGLIPRGEKQPYSKLKQNQVEHIRELYKLGATTHEMGRVYGVSSGTISYAVRRISWQWLK